MKRFLLSAALLLACSGVALAQESEFSGGGGGGITAAPGSGTAGRVPQFASTTSLEDSKMLTSGTNSGTWTLYDSTGGSGLTRLILRAGDTQADGNPLLEVFNSAGASMSGGYGVIMYNTGSYYLVAPDIISPVRASFALASNGLRLSTSAGVNFSSNGTDYGSADVALYRSAAGILAVTDGSTGSGGIGIADAATATVTDALILRHATSGTAAASFGTGLLFQGEDAAGNMQSMASLQAVYTDASNGSEDSKLQLVTMYNGTLTEAGVFDVDTGNPRLTFNGSFGIIRASAALAITTGGVIYFTPETATNAWIMSGTYLSPGATNTYNIGTSGTLVKDSYLGTSIQGTRTKTLTDNTITDVVQISSTAGADANGVTAGHVSYTIIASDATTDKVQTEVGQVPFLLVNENGTVTVTLGTVGVTAIDSAGGAALSNTFASSVSGTNAKIRVTSDYDQATLTGTVTHTIEYRVYIDSGTATVTPQ